MVEKTPLQPQRSTTPTTKNPDIKADADSKPLVREETSKRSNQWLVFYLHTILEDSRKDVNHLRTKLAITYWIVVLLSIIMFALGIALLGAPAIAAYKGDIALLESLTSAGFGVADLTALFMFKPIERIHGLMGDMSQITVAINSFQDQVALRLMEMDASKRESMGKAAEEIKGATRASLELIEIYFEGKRGGKL